jgi:hypothetical protein
MKLFLVNKKIKELNLYINRLRKIILVNVRNNAELPSL